MAEIKFNFPKEERVVIEDDGVYRYAPTEIPNMSKRELIITKNTFIECYKKWIKEES
jgi:hypothetical protein